MASGKKNDKTPRTKTMKRKIKEAQEYGKGEKNINSQLNEVNNSDTNCSEDNLCGQSTSCPFSVKKYRTTNVNPTEDILFDDYSNKDDDVVSHCYDTDVSSPRDSPTLAPIIHRSHTEQSRSPGPNSPTPSNHISCANSDHERSVTPTLFSNEIERPYSPPITPVSYDRENSCSNERTPATRRNNKYDYFDTSTSSSSDDEDTKKTNGRFSPLSEESRKSPARKKVVYMSKPSTAYRMQAFSPLPSTSKDNETIMKNDKHFSESLIYDNNNHEMQDSDSNDSLPNIVTEAKHKNIKKKHKSSDLRQALESINNYTQTDLDENMSDANNNNSVPFNDYASEIDVPVVTIKNNSSVAGQRKSDDNDVALQPTADHTSKIVDTIEINDDYSTISDSDLYSVPKATEEVIDVDEFFAEFNAYKEKKNKQISERTKSVVDSKGTESTCSTEVIVGNSVPTQTSPVEVVSESTTTERPSTLSPDIEITGVVEPRNRNSSRRANSNYTYWNDDVEFVSEIPPDEVINSGIRVSSNSQPNSETNQNVAPSSYQDEIVTIVNGFFSGQSDNLYVSTNAAEINELQMVFSFLTDTCSRYMQPQRRRKRSTIAESMPQQSLKENSEAVAINNENTAPSESSTPPENGERRLGDCPICMENLSNSFIASTTCGHVFCLECIKRSLRATGKRCPTCRKVLKGTGYHQVFL